MKRPRGKYHHGALARDAVDAAAKEIDAHGHDRFTLDNVAKRLGVTPAALYRHYDGREALLKAFVWQTFVRFAGAVDTSVVEAVTPRGRVLALERVMTAFALENRGWFRLQFSHAGIALDVPHDDANLQYPALVLEAIGTLLDTRDQKQIESTYLTAWALIHGIASLMLEGVWGHLTTDDERRSTAESLFAGYIDSLGPSAEKKTAKKKTAKKKSAKKKSAKKKSAKKKSAKKRA